MKRAITQGSAIVKAQRAWGECALYARQELRSAGVRGSLRRLDDYASGQRGGGAAQGILAMAFTLAQSGMARADIVARLTQTVEQMAELGYAEAQRGGAA